MILITGPKILPRGGNQQLGDAVATYPLTHSQEGVWVGYLADRSSTQYNHTLGWSLNTSTEPQPGLQEIAAAIHELNKGHSILRSTIISLQGKPHIQEHDPNTATPIIRLLTILDGIKSEQQLHQALHESFDLENAFPVRWYVVQRSWGKQVFLVSHHIALDDGALTRLSREFLECLDGGIHVSIKGSEEFSQAHSVERAWSQTKACEDAHVTCLLT
ncbi:hypothetical protein DL95DRAFT_448683 [Leptodontidium sp. 2 PMI_412]|nr:hypothetical protein DL95DRAFT_448683 [Leptodontidium sp. 2 PMI_412]